MKNKYTLKEILNLKKENDKEFDERLSQLMKAMDKLDKNKSDQNIANFQLAIKNFCVTRDSYTDFLYSIVPDYTHKLSQNNNPDSNLMHGDDIFYVEELGIDINYSEMFFLSNENIDYSLIKEGEITVILNEFGYIENVGIVTKINAEDLDVEVINYLRDSYKEANFPLKNTLIFSDKKRVVISNYLIRHNSAINKKEFFVNGEKFENSDGKYNIFFKGQYSLEKNSNEEFVFSSKVGVYPFYTDKAGYENSDAAYDIIMKAFKKCYEYAEFSDIQSTNGVH